MEVEKQVLKKERMEIEKQFLKKEKGIKDFG
jgi:hypothetical protein